MSESKNESTGEMMNEENARALITWLRSRVAMPAMRVDRGEVVQLLDVVDWLFEKLSSSRDSTFASESLREDLEDGVKASEKLVDSIVELKVENSRLQEENARLRAVAGLPRNLT